MAVLLFNLFSGPEWNEMEVGPAATNRSDAPGSEALAIPNETSMPSEAVERQPVPDPQTARAPIEESNAANSPGQREIRFLVLATDTGEPIFDARVEGGGWTGTTDPEGYATRVLEESETYSRHWVHISAHGYVAQRESVRPGQFEYETKLSPGAPFDVQVVDAVTGARLEHVEIRATHFDEDNPKLRYHAEVQTSSDGVATFPFCHPQLELDLDLKLYGYLPSESKLTVDGPGPYTVEMGAGGQLHITMTRADGSPVPSAQLDLHNPKRTLQAWQSSMHTDDAGRTSLRGLEFETPYYLSCERPKSRSRVFTFSEGDPEQWVELVSEEVESHVIVRVVDEEAAPWENVRVAVHRRLPPQQSGWPSSFTQTRAGSSVTIEDGTASFPLQTSGPMTMTLAHSDGVTVEREFNIEPGETQQFEFVYPRGISFSGRFLDESNEPLPAHSVTYKGLSTTTDDQGLFEFHGINREPGQLIIQRRDRERDATPTLLTWMHYENFVPTNERAEFRRVEPVLIRGTCPAESEIAETRWTVSLGPRGRFGNNRVLPLDGIARVRVASNSLAPWTVSIEFPPRSPTAQIFRQLQPSPGTVVDLGELRRTTDRLVTGTVRWSDSTPVAGAVVDLSLAYGGWSTEATTDERGAFQFRNVPSGSGWLSCSEDDANGARGDGDISFPDSAESVALDLNLVVPQKARGVARHANGKPAMSARVWFFRVKESGEYGSGSGVRCTAEGAFELDLDPGLVQVFVKPFGSETMVAAQRFEMPETTDIELLVEVP